MVDPQELPFPETSKLRATRKIKRDTTGRVSSPIVLLSLWILAVRELERSTLAYLRDSNFPADRFVILHLFGREKGGGCRVFSKRVTECSSDGDKVGSC